METLKSKDKVVMITGASKGIGRATAQLLDELGYKLVLGARDTSVLNEEFSREAVLKLNVDVRIEDSVKRFVQQSIDKFGKIDVLINAAGLGVFSNIVDSQTEDFDQMIAVNLRGTYLTCKYVAKNMRNSQEGQILNLVSVAGTTALAGCGGYSASKFGVLGLTRVLQAELRHEGIRLTSVIPGAVSSSFWDSIEPKPDFAEMIPVQSIAEYLVFLINQPKQSSVDEVTIMPPNGIL
ncbi:SDR family NAD(P)-dependent oxidoreductase [Psychrobacillus sp. PGGUH221]|uniref:SDR family oxidoreductase n=1 Tax=Psychrobacillus sp. PGGUH221 TaxID=3020058 RepID=UPI0035C771C3